jgi:predicted amidophosphoribosyltransferase
MTCSFCGHDNPDAARFCNACGQAVAARCGSCGIEPPDARFAVSVALP